MALVLTPTTYAAMWGLLGAFIYAGPKWLACVSHIRERCGSRWFCVAEGSVSMTIGAIAAAAFASLALTALHIKDQNAVATLVGFLANRVDTGKLVGSLFGGRLGKLLEGDRE